jgi:hypothetical protein
MATNTFNVKGSIIGYVMVMKSPPRAIKLIANLKGRGN